MDQPPPMDLPARRSTRLLGFDYASNAAYVITICTYERRPLFGGIIDGQLHPSWLGQIVEREWRRTAELRRGVLLDAFILMPNHLHGILILNLPEEGTSGKERVGRFVAPSVGLGAIVRGFKSAVTSAARKERPGMGPVWQRGYYDRIIRSEAELQRFRQYMAHNVQQWELDRYFAPTMGGQVATMPEGWADGGEEGGGSTVSPAPQWSSKSWRIDSGRGFPFGITSLGASRGGASRALAVHCDR